MYFKVFEVHSNKELLAYKGWDFGEDSKCAKEVDEARGSKSWIARQKQDKVLKVTEFVKVLLLTPRIVN